MKFCVKVCSLFMVVWLIECKVINPTLLGACFYFGRAARVVLLGARRVLSCWARGACFQHVLSKSRTQRKALKHNSFHCL